MAEMAGGQQANTHRRFAAAVAARLPHFGLTPRYCTGKGICGSWPQIRETVMHFVVLQSVRWRYAKSFSCRVFRRIDTTWRAAC